MSGACSSACGYCGRCESGPRCNATCSACSEEFWIEYDSTGSLCDRCCDARDAAVSVRPRMVKAGAGPHPCCVDFGLVIACDGTTTTNVCGVCGTTFAQPCADADIAALARGA